jgi:5S rRNA maturation endonuclease (ribonuclease M5)
LPTDTVAEVGDLAQAVYNAEDVFVIDDLSGTFDSNVITLAAGATTAGTLVKVNYIADVKVLLPATQISALPAVGSNNVFNTQTAFGIGSKMLEHYNVAPLSFYTMTKEDNLGIATHMNISANYIYGYFKSDGTLYKIYQPKVKDSKFIKVRDYIQGSEQLRGDKKFLVITSSLKDLMAFNKLKLTDAEYISPDSENSMIPTNYMVNAIKHYKNVFVLFDNDEAGQKAAQKYQKMFGVATVNLPMEKDLSDSVKVHGIDAVRSALIPLLKEAL